MLENHKKVSFFIEKSILGWKSASDKAAFKSNFKFEDGDTLRFLIYRQLTFMLHYRNHGFLRMEFSISEGVWNLSFSFEGYENTFHYYLKSGFSLFCPL